MKQVKKVIALILSVVLLSAVCLPVTSYAETTDSSTTNTSSSVATGFKRVIDNLQELFNTLITLVKNVINNFLTSVDVSDVYVLDGNSDEESQTPIRITINDGAYYLYLPSYMSTDSLIFGSDSSKTVRVNGTNIKRLSSSALSGKSKFTLTYGGWTCTVNIVQSANISSVYVTTESGEMTDIYANKEYKESGSMVYVTADGDVEYNNTLDYIKGRGNSSWQYSKKGFNIKLTTSTDLDGLGKTKKWCLIPNQIDESLLRNQILYDLADEIGLEYSPSNTPVDLYLNGEYNGTYLLVVKTDVNSASVDIDELEAATEDVNDQDLDTYEQVTSSGYNGLTHYKYWSIPNDPDDITGGYILELDYSSYSSEASGFTTSKGQRIVLKYPEYASQAQVEYMGSFYQDFEDAVFSEDGYNDKGKHYSEYIDVESFAKYYLLTEYAENGDSNITSVFMYKESDVTGDGLIHAGPVWDYDSALGNNGGTKYFEATVKLTNTQQQYYSVCKSYNTDYLHIYAALYRHSDFREVVAEVYENDFAPALSILVGETASTGTLQSFDYYVDNISTAANMNFTRWQILSSSYTGAQTGTTYSANIEFLENFLINRYAFLENIKDYYCEDYLYMFIENSQVYGVTSFDDMTVELVGGSSDDIGNTVTCINKTYTVTSVK